MKQCSALFVMAPGGVTTYFSEHLGTAFLRAVLQRAGLNSTQYLPKYNPGLNAFESLLRDQRPPLVGFTVYETNLITSIAMARVVRDVLPQTMLAVGGPNATFSPEETLSLLDADVCVRGAGEGTIVDLVRIAAECDTAPDHRIDALSRIPNLAIRSSDGPLFTRTTSLGSFPVGYYTSLDDLPSPYQMEIVESPDIGFLTARGCNQNCTYCSFASVSQRRVHFHSVERVLDDLAAFESLVRRSQRRVPTITIYDDAFTLSPQRAARICEGILSRGIRLPLACETRGDRVDASLLRLMHRAGFVAVAFGLESAVPKVLRAIGKVSNPTTAEDPFFHAERGFLESFKSSVASARDSGLDVTVSIMGGLPAETLEDFQTTLAFVQELKVSFYAHNILNVMPGTPLFVNRKAYGLDCGRDPELLLWSTHHAYEPSAVPALRHSTVHLWKWQEAELLSDAICGRPRVPASEVAAPWAVVIDGHAPNRVLADWLRNVLAVNGLIVIIDHNGRTPLRAWWSLLIDAGVPYGKCALLSRKTMGDDVFYITTGTIGKHRFRFGTEFDDEDQMRPLAVDEFGNCDVPVWVASASGASSCSRIRVHQNDFGPARVQVADPCRWWAFAARCKVPQVLHVKSDGEIRACWHGPKLGSVGEAFAEIAARALGAWDRVGTPGDSVGAQPCCPMRCGADGEDVQARLVQLDLKSQLAWLFPPGRASGTT